MAIDTYVTPQGSLMVAEANGVEVPISRKYSMVTKPAEAASARLLLAAVLVEIDEKYPSDFSEGAGAPSRLTLRLDSSSF